IVRSAKSDVCRAATYAPAPLSRMTTPARIERVEGARRASRSFGASAGKGSTSACACGRAPLRFVPTTRSSPWRRDLLPELEIPGHQRLDMGRVRRQRLALAGVREANPLVHPHRLRVLAIHPEKDTRRAC